MTVNGQSSSILSVLVIGAGTDYALLLVARYREELRRHEDKHEAMELALRRAGPAIIASGLTVMVALLSLTLAEGQRHRRASGRPARSRRVLLVRDPPPADDRRSLPVGCRAYADRADRTPAVLAAHPADAPGVDGCRPEPRRRRRRRDLASPRCSSTRPHGVGWPFERMQRERGRRDPRLWRRSATRRAHRRRVIAGVLVVMSLGLLNYSTGLTQGNSFRDEVESIAGPGAHRAGVPVGPAAPTDIVVRDPSQVAAVVRAAQGVDGVAEVTPRPVEQGGPGAQLAAFLESTPTRRRRSTSSPSCAPRSPRPRRARSSAGRPRSSTTCARRRRPTTRPAHPARARDRVPDPRRAAAGARRAAAAHRDRRAVVPRGARRRRDRLRRDLRLPGQRPVAAAVRVHLPRRAGRRLQHLPHGARPRGDAQARHARGHAARPGGDRRRHHRGGHRARGHVRGARRAAADVPDRDRLRRRVRRPARHVHRAVGARPGARVRHRAEDLVAVEARRAMRATAREPRR